MRRVQLALELQPLFLRSFDRSPFERGMQSRRATSRVRTYWLASSVSPWSHFRSRIKSVAAASCRTRGPGHRGCSLRKRLHGFKRSHMSYSSRTANWGRRHSELERFERKPAPDLIRVDAGSRQENASKQESRTRF